MQYDKKTPDPFSLPTVTYWAGDDSYVSLLDWVNPLEIFAWGGDIGRTMQRELTKELVGLTATVLCGGEPYWTFGFSPDGVLLSAGRWRDGQLESRSLDEVSEGAWRIAIDQIKQE